jgi:CubicO group peptidase (beta-lactamase class C family)
VSHNRLEEHIVAWMARQHVPGLSVSVIRDGEIAWSRGFGVLDATTQQPVTSETIFPAASLSKPVFAYAVLKLSELGVLALDKPLSAYLPEPYLPDEPRLAPVTARHVLSHSGGLPNWRREGQPLRVHFEPGQRFAYSGEGFAYLQRVIEHLLGEPLAVTMRARLLEPLGMHASSYAPQETDEARTAAGHDAHGERQGAPRPDKVSAAYSLHSTPADLARLMLAILRPPKADAVHLSQRTICEMLTPQIAVNDHGLWVGEPPDAPITTDERVFWGLGWGLERHDGAEGFWHWGDNGLWHAFALGLPAGVAGMVAMTNGESGRWLWRPLVSETLGGQHPAVDWLESVYRMVHGE